VSEASADTDGPAQDDRTLAAELEVLREENRRLRREYSRARQAEYTQMAAILAGLGVVGFLGGVVYPSAQTVLFAFGGTGVFLASLLYFLTPERFVPATLGADIYATLSQSEAEIVAGLGLTDTRVYVPTDDDSVRLFVPQRADYRLPDETHRGDPFVVTEEPAERGITFPATGDPLYETYTDVSTTGGAGIETTVERLADALLEQFELVDTVETDVAEGRASLGVTGSLYGRLDRVDHPVVSFLAVGIVRDRDHPVTVAVETPDNDRVEYLVTCTWPAE